MNCMSYLYYSLTHLNHLSVCRASFTACSKLQEPYAGIFKFSAYQGSVLGFKGQTLSALQDLAYVDIDRMYDSSVSI